MPALQKIITRLSQLVLDAGNKALANVRTASFASVIDLGDSGVAPNIDWSAGGRQRITLNQASVTLTFSPPPGVSHLVLFIKQDATGGRAITFPAGVRWEGGSSPTLTATAEAEDVLTLLYDGANYYGALGPNFKTA